MILDSNLYESLMEKARQESRTASRVIKSDGRWLRSLWETVLIGIVLLLSFSLMFLFGTQLG